MTATTWNSEQLNLGFTGCQTLRDMISQLETDAAIRGEVLCEIRVNGELFQEEDEKRYSDKPRTDIWELTIRCDRPGSLVEQALQSAIGFIPLLSAASLSTADCFRNGEIHQGSERFLEALEGCQWFIETVYHVRSASSGIGVPVFEIERWLEAEKIFTKVIQEITETFGGKDYILTSDILEYELTGTIEMWLPLLQKELGRRI